MLWISGDIEMSISLPHRDYIFNVFYENNYSDNWYIKNVEFTDQLKNKIYDQQQKEIKNINKLLKSNKKITLKDFEEAADMKINSIKMMGKNYKSEFNTILKNMKSKERKEFLMEAKDNEGYLDAILDFENELIEMKKGSDFLIYFDSFKKSGNSAFLKTVTDGGLLIESSFKNSFKRNKTNVFFTDGSSVNLEGNCDKQLVTTNKINNDGGVESKLKKLKSLFENELITEEEYDAKRKEILDEM
tara:strand:+ start:1163 stop:1897 length:735 start_codon:yes stop_codon:yes gene_type:complete